MTIANPIYDIVFKYLLEDLDIAKGMLSTILNVEIAELTVQPQETTVETDQDGKAIRIYRIDFAAIVKQKDGSTKKILIELQKSKRNTNVLRFRRYLAENYQKQVKRKKIFVICWLRVCRPKRVAVVYGQHFP